MSNLTCMPMICLGKMFVFEAYFTGSNMTKPCQTSNCSLPDLRKGQEEEKLKREIKTMAEKGQAASARNPRKSTEIRTNLQKLVPLDQGNKAVEAIRQHLAVLTLGQNTGKTSGTLKKGRRPTREEPL